MNNKVFLEYFLILLLISASGNQVLYFFGDEVLYISLFAVSFSYWALFSKRLEINAFFFLSAVFVVLLSHLLIYGTMVINASIGYFLKVATGIFFIFSINKFPQKYVNVLCAFGCISLVFYLPQAFGLPLRDFFSNLNLMAGSNIVHIGIYNFHNGLEFRNSGPFWEPGAFAGYLVVAFFINIFLLKKSAKDYSNIIIIITLFSTQSTMGILSFLLIFIVYNFTSSAKITNNMKLIYLLVFFPSVVIAVVLAVTQLDFLYYKILMQMQDTASENGVYQINRFGNILYDLDFIRLKPFLGWSVNPETRFFLDPSLKEFISGQGVGLTGLIVRFGFPFAIYLLLTAYFSSARIYSNRAVSSVFLIVLVFMLVGEQYQNYPLFYSIILLGFSKRDIFNEKHSIFNS